jgi:hypothetical protein
MPEAKLITLAARQFQMPLDGPATAIELNEVEWHMLLDGIVVREGFLLRRHRRESAAMGCEPSMRSRFRA